MSAESLLLGCSGEAIQKKQLIREGVRNEDGVYSEVNEGLVEEENTFIAHSNIFLAILRLSIKLYTSNQR